MHLRHRPSGRPGRLPGFCAALALSSSLTASGCLSDPTPMDAGALRRETSSGPADGQDTRLPGPYEVAELEVLEGQAGATTSFDLYLPDADGAFPAIVLGHGFSQYKDYQADNARHLASWGFVVLAPTFSTYADHVANGAEMLELADWLTSDLNPYRAKVDEARLGLAGHSAGGLSAIVAAGMDANNDRRISAVVGLDPVDVVTAGGSEGQPFAEIITAPTLVLAGIPYSCNSDGNSQGLFDALPASTPRMFLRLTDAVHCDFNTQGIDHACSPDTHPARPAKIARLLATQGWAAAYDAATAGVCAVDGMEADRSSEVDLVEQYLAAWFLAELADEPWAETYRFDGAALEADMAAGIVEDLQYGG